MGGGKKSPSNAIVDALRNPVPTKANVTMLLKPSPGYSLAALSEEIMVLLNEGQYCLSII